MWDAIVVGGGPAGSWCAAALARESWRVLLVDARQPAKRALLDTLAPETCRRLRTCLPSGVTLDDIGVRCRGLLARWHDGEPLITDYELEQCCPGYAVSRPATDDLLLRHAACHGAVVRRSWRCVRVDAGDRARLAGVHFLTPLGRQSEETRLVIAATGRAGIPGLPPRAYLDRQLAFAATIDTGETHDLLWVERADEGWWYLTPASATATQIVFVSTSGTLPPRHPHLGQCLSEALARTRLLRRAFSSAVAIQRVSIHDARTSAPAAPCAPRLLLVGDAAGTVDPLSGQGWSRALQSGQAVAERADGYLRSGRSLDPLEHHRENTAWFAGHRANRERIFLDASPLA